MIKKIFSKTPVAMFTIFTALFVILVSCGKISFDTTTGIILSICYVIAVFFDLIGDALPETIIRKDGFTVYIKKEKGGYTHTYILNSKDDPVVGVSISENKHEETGYQYIVGFSNEEKNVYAINPKNGAGKKIFGYNDKLNDDV